jgi:electron transfer flavoprotein alpha subunit
MATNRDVWVFVEQHGGVVAGVSLELLTKGAELAEKLGSQVVAVVLGHRIPGRARAAIHQGADRVYVADDPQLATYRTLPYARVVVDLVRENEPYIVLFGATPVGRDLGPRIASACLAGLTADCTGLEIGDVRRSGKEYHDLLHQIRPAFGGNVIATIINPEMHPQMATVREGVMQAAQPDPRRSGEIIRIEPAFEKADFALRVVESRSVTPACDLKNAQVIVAGGAGVGSKEDFQLIFDLAHALGGEVGASRAAVDAGYVSPEHQVGQTGMTVRPRVYVACGISGAVQHRAGMDESSRIIAINSDPNAPIFQIAHYKVVGDLKEVIPAMIEELDASQGQGESRA